MVIASPMKQVFCLCTPEKVCSGLPARSAPGQPSREGLDQHLWLRDISPEQSATLGWADSNVRKLIPPNSGMEPKGGYAMSVIVAVLYDRFDEELRLSQTKESPKSGPYSMELPRLTLVKLLQQTITICVACGLHGAITTFVSR